MADYWLKLYIEILDDPKMATLPDRLWRRIIELFLVAKKLNKGGHLPDTRQIAWVLRMNPEELEHDMTQISTTKIVVQEVGGWFIPKFASRQAAATPKERKSQQREREHSQQYYGDVTEQSRNVTQRQNQITEAETETENNNNGADLSKRSAMIANLLHVPECNGGPDAWYGGLKALADMGASDQHINKAYLSLVSNTRKKYTLVGPQSLVTATANVMQAEDAHSSSSEYTGVGSQAGEVLRL